MQAKSFLSAAALMMAVVAGQVALADTLPANDATMRSYRDAERLHSLLDQGEARKAIDFFSSLPESVSAAILDAPGMPARTAQFEGRTVSLAAMPSGQSVRADLAAAHYVLGDPPAVAKSTLSDAMFARGRARLDCPPVASTRVTLKQRMHEHDYCESANLVATKLAFLELVLNHPEEDPFVFLEQSYGNALAVDFDEGPQLPHDRLWMTALCRRLEEPTYADFCSKRRLLRFDPTVDESRSSLSAVEEAFFPPYVEHLLSRTLQTKWTAETEADAVWPKDMTPLPKGFAVVRVDAQGKEVVAISKSADFNSGDFYSGGYWLHISRDHGQNWDKPLFMGLVEHFPYVVMPTSHLSMRRGDMLQIEVSNRQWLNVHAIGGPHVMLSDDKSLYVSIDVTELRKDSDGDGLTDVEERMLLLDPENRDCDGDGIPDGDDMMPTVVQASADTSARSEMTLQILQHLLKVDYPPGKLTTPAAPLLVVSDPALFAGLRMTYPVLVYTSAQFSRLWNVSPTFSTLGISVVFNRTATRALVSWRYGAGAGTTEIWRDAEGWHSLELWGWVT